MIPAITKREFAAARSGLAIIEFNPPSVEGSLVKTRNGEGLGADYGRYCGKNLGGAKLFDQL